MDKRAIGVFDSGLGGLTAVRRLHALMPQENIIYFGDTGRVPYGTRGRDIITKYARQDVAFLRQFDLKSIIIACNTVSAIALDLLSKENDIPIIGRRSERRKSIRFRPRRRRPVWKGKARLRDRY